MGNFLGCVNSFTGYCGPTREYVQMCSPCLPLDYNVIWSWHSAIGLAATQMVIERVKPLPFNFPPSGRRGDREKRGAHDV